MSLGYCSLRYTAVDKSFRAGLTYARRISPVKRREGEEEEKKMMRVKEEREKEKRSTRSLSRLMGQTVPPENQVVGNIAEKVRVPSTNLP